MLSRYLQEVRCPEGLPSIGSDQERTPLVVGMQRAVAGRPLVPGIKPRVARQRIAQLGQIAAAQLEEAATRAPIWPCLRRSWRMGSICP